MRKTSRFLLVPVLLASLLLLATPTLADPAATITPSIGTTSIPITGAPGNATVNGWLTAASGTSYTVDWTGLNATTTYMLVIIADAQAVTLGDNTAQITANSIDMYSHEAPYQKVGSGVVTAVADMSGGNPQGGGPQGGPPAEARGMWVSTNAIEWNIEPSEMDSTGKPKSFKMTISGPSGVAGFFKWFWPKALMNKVGITANDLAGYIDNDQVSMNTTTYADGSALISFNLTYSQHIIKTAKALPLSLATNKKRVKKNTKVKLFGWYSNSKSVSARSAKVVSIYRKLKGQKKYSLIGKAKTGAKGFFSKTIPVKKTASFIAKALKGKKVIKSPVKTVSVK